MINLSIFPKALLFTFFLNPLLGQFVEVSSTIGVNASFGHGNLGGGLSFSDFNNDGWDDLTIATQKGQKIKFYINNRGVFESISPLVHDTSEVKSVLWADLDNDGDKDFYITCHEGKNKMFRNDGNLQMTEISPICGISQIADPSFGAAFGDIDNDGLLDLYTVNYYDGTFVNSLYKNLGNLQFTDITIQSGVQNSPDLSFQPHFFDFNNDSNSDIYVAVDKDFPNLLYKNLGNGTFSEVGASSGTNIRIFAMNSSSGDIDNDGDLDLYVSNIPDGNVLLRNNGNETFTDITNQAHVSFNRIGWATSFIDVENDGDLDMYVSAMDLVEPNALFINDGNGVFSEPLRYSGGIGGNDVERTLCNISGDFNNDGLQDLATSNEFYGPIWIYKNVCSNGGNWIKLKMEGTVSNKGGIGSWISTYCNGKVYSRHTNCGIGYLGQLSDYINIGLGSADKIDSMIIKWPSGITNKYYDLNVNQFIPVVEDAASITSTNPCPFIMDLKFPNLGLDADYYAREMIRVSGILDRNVTFHTQLIEVKSDLHLSSIYTMNVANPCTN